MTKDELQLSLNRALDRFFERDNHLLAANMSERSMSHQLAVYLAEEIRGYDVDCEYNLDGIDVKRLGLGERQTSDADEEAVTVFPDIVVHRRGNNESNLLVVEMKKSANTRGAEYDLEKLGAFVRELRYRCAAHI